MRKSFLLLSAAMLAAITTAPPAAAGSRPLNPELSAPAAADELSAAKRKKRARAHRAYGYGGTQIACTRFGCHPIPRRCGITTEYNFWTLDPSGFDAVVCR